MNTPAFRPSKAFPLKRLHIIFRHYALWQHLAAILFWFTFPLTQHGRLPFGHIEIYLGMGLIYFPLLWVAFLHVKKIHSSSVSIDGDGLWLSHLPKESALIPWQAIHETKRLSFLHSLALLDSHGCVLLRINCDLDGYETLRTLLAEKTKSHLELQAL